MTHSLPWRSLVRAAFAAIICLTLVTLGHADSASSGLIAIAAGDLHTVNYEYQYFTKKLR